MLRRLLLNIHMYGGLLACGYFIVLGLSSLQFNHHFLPDPPAPVNWSAEVPAPAAGNDQGTAVNVRDQLGLMGGVAERSVKRSPEGTLQFMIYRPGRSYEVGVSPAGHVEVKEQRNTLFLLQAMHVSTGSPGSKWMSVWGAYVEVSTLFGFLAMISGTYLFLSTRRDRLWAGGILIASTAVSLGLMAYVLWIG